MFIVNGYLQDVELYTCMVEFGWVETLDRADADVCALCPLPFFKGEETFDWWVSYLFYGGEEEEEF